MVQSSIPALLVCLIQLSQQSSVSVLTREGYVKGYSHKVPQNHNVFQFLGIPFAKPPVGRLRFAAPVPLDVRSDGGAFDAIVPAHPCVAMVDTAYGNFSGSDMWNDRRNQTEDCLQLNLWTPVDLLNSNEIERKAVMVWIYGGGFFSGSPSLALYDGKFLAAQGDVILVNINYRLGPFGFAYFGADSSVPGNAGLLDQQLALQWIYNNIHAFGGDKNRITLFGESAGGASVSAHMLAPNSKPLFSGAILQSGSITNRWALTEPNIAFERNRALAERLACNGGDVEGVIECLRKLSPRLIQTESEAMWQLPYVKFMEFPFVPVNRDMNFFGGLNAKRGFSDGVHSSVPVMGGIMKDEGSFWLSYFLSDVFTYSKQTLQSNKSNRNNISVDQFNTCLRQAFSKYYPEVLVNAIGYQYTNDMLDLVEANYSYLLRDAVNQFVGDFCFSCDVLSLLSTIADHDRSNVFAYYFTARSSANAWPVWMGAMHGYEIEYVFGGPFTASAKYNQSAIHQEKEFSKQIIQMWSDFAKKRYADKGWPSLAECASTDSFMQLSQTQVKLIPNPKKSVCSFWHSLNSMNSMYEYGAKSVNAVGKGAPVTSSSFLLIHIFVQWFMR